MHWIYSIRKFTWTLNIPIEKDEFVRTCASLEQHFVGDDSTPKNDNNCEWISHENMWKYRENTYWWK